MYDGRYLNQYNHEQDTLLHPPCPDRDSKQQQQQQEGAMQHMRLVARCFVSMRPLGLIGDVSSFPDACVCVQS